MTNAKNDNWIIQTMQQLNLPDAQYAVFGSGLLDVLGIKKANDIDLVVTKELFDTLGQQGEWARFVYPDGYPGLKHAVYDMELFYRSDMPLCDLGGVERMIRDAVAIQGIKFVQLKDILVWKKSLGREKDVRAVKLIEAYIKELRL